MERMNEHNLADPDFEPTDEQLQELMKSAFANVKADQASMDRLRPEIAQARAIAFRCVSKCWPIHEPGVAGCRRPDLIR
jgi:hypothetical protein